MSDIFRSHLCPTCGRPREQGTRRVLCNGCVGSTATADGTFRACTLEAGHLGHCVDEAGRPMWPSLLQRVGQAMKDGGR